MQAIYLAILFLSLCVYLAKKHFRQLQLSSRIPGPQGLPLIGNGLDLINKSTLGKVEMITGKSSFQII